MLTRFWKMHGAGNDFILIDDRVNSFPNDKELVRTICSRHTGIGSEGLILIRESSNADFAMRFFNPDGNEADMCGNGGRCIARLAYDLNIAEEFMRFETNAGIISAEIMDSVVKLDMPPPSNLAQNRMLTLDDGTTIAYEFINTGVPHVVIQTHNLEDYPVAEHGIAIVKHHDFSPAETNVNFIEVIDRYSIRIRTFERGVEAETLACGTGITAAAATMALCGLVAPPVTLLSAGGDTLTVDFTVTDNSLENVTLTGPAEYVFCGEFSSDDCIIPAPPLAGDEYA